VVNEWVEQPGVSGRAARVGVEGGPYLRRRLRGGEAADAGGVNEPYDHFAYDHFGLDAGTPFEFSLPRCESSARW
jgi:hypothetical protein